MTSFIKKASVSLFLQKAPKPQGSIDKQEKHGYYKRMAVAVATAFFLLRFNYRFCDAQKRCGKEKKKRDCANSPFSERISFTTVQENCAKQKPKDKLVLRRFQRPWAIIKRHMILYAQSDVAVTSFE
ncbi:MAG TPA: hypothetical protein IAC31_08735 [Candidatus Faecousia intestinigallinarum]|nr:hypothetical protein [Candidatus Faecousia intestinigallinarum]